MKRPHMTLVYILLIALLAALAFVRLSPIDPNIWHSKIAVNEDKNFKGGAVRVIPAGDDTLAKLDKAMRALPRTKVVAGSVADGRITYVTRTQWAGFPDFTTVEQDGDVVKLYARLRFGRSDFGVNRARLRQVIATVQG